MIDVLFNIPPVVAAIALAVAVLLVTTGLLFGLAGAQERMARQLEEFDQ